jgi:hypothetical protein
MDFDNIVYLAASIGDTAMPKPMSARAARYQFCVGG